MKELLVYLKKYKKEAILGPLFKLLEAFFDLTVPLVMASLIDKGIRLENQSYIFRMGGILVLLAVVGLSCTLVAQYFAAKAAVGVSTDLRSELFGHIQSLSYSDVDRIGTSTLITRMTSDINQVQTGINISLRLLLRSPFIVFGAMIMAFTVDVKAAWVFAVTIPLLSVVVFGIMVITMPMYRRVQESLDQVLNRTRENLTGARVLRAFGREEDEKKNFYRENDILTAMQIAVGKFSALTNPLTLVIVNVATLAIIWIGGEEVSIGTLTQGQVVALVNYMSQILVELVKLANVIITISKSLASMNRISAVLATEAALKDGSLGVMDENASEYLVSFEHVSMTYPGSGEAALKDISLQVRPGQIIGIIGGTGSGKSTLVNLIPRFYDVSQGELRICGSKAGDYRTEFLRSQVGVVAQKSVLFAGTIAENLRMGNENASEEDMMEALKLAQALDVIQSKKDGLEEVVEEGGKNFSGGQKQRLAIARALVRKPKILILDDSASALDYATDAALRKALSGLKGRVTTFIVSQRTSSIRFADQILVLDDGRAVGLGKHEELLHNCSVYREIYDSQFQGGQENA